jgi:hypothetical protein|tara:strand:+ start:347 stop:721 length:375 start_codon:yes stop_codon:yes gene_type:complete
MAHFPVKTEKQIRKLIERQKFVVVVHTKSTCPVCDVFVPDVLVPIFKDEKYKHVNVYEVTEPLTFPTGSHPVTYFFREGLCVQHPAGAAPDNVVKNLLDTMYCGKLPPIMEINTNVPKPGEFNG